MSKLRKYTDEQEARALALWNEGKTLREIGVVLGAMADSMNSRMCLSRAIRRAAYLTGIPARVHVWKKRDGTILEAGPKLPYISASVRIAKLEARVAALEDASVARP